MSSPDPRLAAVAVSADQVERVLAATRLVGGLIAESLANLEPPLTMPQWRVLVLASQSDCNVSAVAEDLRVHMSSATRICDRLVGAGLLERRRAEHDRRQVLLAPTPAGQALFEKAMQHRRGRIEQTMALMGTEDRAALAASVSVFVTAATRARTAGPADQL